MAESVRLGMVGCGGMAGGHLRAYLRIMEAEPARLQMAATCDPVRERADEFAAQAAQAQGWTPAVYGSVGEMLEREPLDAVDIASPHGLHHVIAIECLQAGAHVLIEKPFGVTIRASRAIIAAAENAGRIAATAEQVRRGLSQRTARWLLQDRQLLGEVQQFYAQHAGYSDPARPRNWAWRADRDLGGGGMVIDSGAHYCDTLRYLFGDPHSVFASVRQLCRRPLQRGEEVVDDTREDTWVATIEFESGIVGLWSCSYSAPGHSFTRVVYYGTEGCLLDEGDVFHGPFPKGRVILKDEEEIPMETLQQEFLASLSDAERTRLFPHGWTDGVTLECYDFVRAASEGGQVEVDGTAGMKAKAIAEAIYESAAAGQSVSYQDVLDGRVEVYQRPINEHWGL
jgi:UDP-N-acetyl-2-amino-2-deoxyglucuronate dehydrogenase